ncbi:MAG: enoyl-CoA hydratase/isomerase family protein [Sulfuricaulis sp.]|uniref:enoyl-CoA hydratase/isomerase family protein n=1 Tax=Sulfuricaulis sp. TaxID=2003553 RepID=UPI0034A40534
MKFKKIKWEVVSSPQSPGDNAIGVLTLDAPQDSNGLGPRMTLELDHILDEIRRHPTVRVVIITGSGDNFCAGGNFRVETIPMERLEDDWGLKGEYGELVTWWMNDYFHIVAQNACKKLEDLPQVTVAAVDGIAVGVGLEMTCSCDLRIVTDRVRFAELAVPAGFMSEWCAPRILPQLIGQTRANEMILTGRFVYAEEALDIGLVNRIVPHRELREEAIAWAGQMASYPRLGMLGAKETLRLYQNANRKEEWMKVEMDRVLEITRTRDCAEGIDAFRTKRRPVYWPGNPVLRPGKEFDPGRNYGKSKVKSTGHLRFGAKAKGSGKSAAKGRSK